MAPIDPLGPLLAQIRMEALRLKRAGALKGAGRKGGGARVEGERAHDWLVDVKRGVAAIGPDEPDSPGKAFRIYLEVRLARELCIRDRAHPAFKAVVERVLASMDASEQVRDAMTQAGQHLLGKFAG